MQVIQYRSSDENDETSFESFRCEAMENKNKMFLMIADECHWGINAGGAVDKIVNDQANGGGLLKQRNFFRLLVSATPYAVLTTASCIPPTFFKHDKEAESSGIPDATSQLQVYEKLDEVDVQSAFHLIWMSRIVSRKYQAEFHIHSRFA